MNTRPHESLHRIVAPWAKRVQELEEKLSRQRQLTAQAVDDRRRAEDHHVRVVAGLQGDVTTLADEVIRLRRQLEERPPAPPVPAPRRELAPPPTVPPPFQGPPVHVPSQRGDRPTPHAKTSLLSFTVRDEDQRRQAPDYLATYEEGIRRIREA